MVMYSSLQVYVKQKDVYVTGSSYLYNIFVKEIYLL